MFNKKNDSYQNKKKTPMVWEILREQNLDWLFFKDVYINPSPNKTTNRGLVYLKVFIQILRSFFKTDTVQHIDGGLFYVDNSRHYEQAKRIIPYTTETNYHNNTSQDLNFGNRINIASGIYKSYSRLIRYFPFIIREEFRRNSQMFSRNLSATLYGILLYEHFLSFFEKNPLRYVVIFSDHSFKNRALMYAAKQQGISTIYIPHASINEDFPPLEMDTAFLEGEDMVTKYSKIKDKWNFNSNTQVIISGNIKINSSRMKESSRKNALGIAFNILDSATKVEEVVKSLLKDRVLADYRIILRPHPQREDSFDFQNSRVEVSNPVKEDVTDYIKRISFLLSGDSNIILDAALLKVPVFVVDFSTEGVKDQYEFLKLGVCPFINNISDLHTYLFKDFQNYQFNDEVLSYFDHSYGQDLNSVKIVTDYLNALKS